MSVGVSFFGLRVLYLLLSSGSASLASVFVLNQVPVYLIPFRVKSYLHPFPGMKYVLIEVLLIRKKERPLELPSAQYSPIPVHPTWALMEILGNLLRSHYNRIRIVVNRVHSKKPISTSKYPVDVTSSPPTLVTFRLAFFSNNEYNPLHRGLIAFTKETSMKKQDRKSRIPVFLSDIESDLKPHLETQDVKQILDEIDFLKSLPSDELWEILNRKDLTTESEIILLQTTIFLLSITPFTLEKATASTRFSPTDR